MIFAKYVTKRCGHYFVGLVLLSFVIGVHEAGHWIAAKSYGVHCPDYSIGFGPGVQIGQWGETAIFIRSIPLGGYVEMAMTAEHLPEGTSGIGIYQVSTFGKVVIFGAGVAVNLLCAIICISLYTRLNSSMRTEDEQKRVAAWDLAIREAAFKKKFWRIFSDGPVNALIYLSRGAWIGQRGIVKELGIFSFGLFLINLLPIPPLDGSRMLDALFTHSFLSGSASVDDAGISLYITLAGLALIVGYVVIGFIPSIIKLVRVERALYKWKGRLESANFQMKGAADGVMEIVVSLPKAAESRA